MVMKRTRCARLLRRPQHEQAEEPGVYVLRRGTNHQAAQLVRAIIANRDEQARTAHDVATETEDRDQLLERVRSLLDRRDKAVQARRAAYRSWHDQRAEQVLEQQRWVDQHVSRDRSQEQSLDYGFEL
jgi:hypothetical protein